MAEKLVTKLGWCLLGVLGTNTKVQGLMSMQTDIGCVL